MANDSHRVPAPKHETSLSLLLGGGFAVALFVLMALAQLLGDVKPPKKELDDQITAFVAPEIEEIEEEELIEEEEEEPPPELEEEPPQLSLDQLDIALNPGTGGSLAGDFALPSIGTSQRDLGTEDFVDFSDLDQIPRPMCGGMDFPRRMKQKKVNGRIVLLLKLDSDGKVLDATVDSSNLPEFDSFVVGWAQRCRFSKPTQQGRPVKAKARLPIPIRIN